MENNNTRWLQRFEHYEKALITIESVIPRYQQLSDLEEDALIRRFEFTFDLAWESHTELSEVRRVPGNYGAARLHYPDGPVWHNLWVYMGRVVNRQK